MSNHASNLEGPKAAVFAKAVGMAEKAKGFVATRGKIYHGSKSN